MRAEILECLRLGMRPIEIRKALGVSPAVVTVHAKSLGLRFIKGNPGRPKNSKNWKRIAAFRRMKVEGKSYSEIGKTFGVTYQAVQLALRPKVNNRIACQACGNRLGHMHRHHVDYATDEIKILCATCHKAVHAGMTIAKRTRKAA